MIPDAVEWLSQQGADADLLAFVSGGFARSNPPEHLGLAVSGGSDSMAMLHLTARAAPHFGWRIAAVTVDHRLRPEAAEEAAFVARTCAGLGVPHTTLAWEDHPASGNLMEQAARARYGLIADWAHGRGIGHVMVAHTADDQAETFLMGLSREAGLGGLSGMRPAWMSEGIRFHRPLLRVSRADLRAYLTRHGLDWRDDPSNANDRYTRVRARRALAALKPLGITVDRLAGTIDNLQKALRVVRQATAETYHRIGDEGAGVITLDREGLAGTDPEMVRLLLVAAIQWVTGTGHPPRADAVFRVQLAIEEGRDATLGGCRVRVSDTAIRIAREPKAVAGLSSPTTAPWDTRWHLDGPHAPDLHIAALGAAGLRLCPGWRDTGLTRDTLLVTPAVWRGEVLIAAALAGRAEGWTATLRPTFASFLQSH